MQPDKVILFALIVLGSAAISVLALRLWPSKAIRVRLGRTVFLAGVVLSCLAAADLVTPVFANHQTAAVTEQALNGGSPELARRGTVSSQEADLLPEGDNCWTRMPSPAPLQGTPPMCGSGVWKEWADAYLYMKDSAGATVGVCYMLASDEGASNIDPYAEGNFRVIARTGASR